MTEIKPMPMIDSTTKKPKKVSEENADEERMSLIKSREESSQISNLKKVKKLNIEKPVFSTNQQPSTKVDFEQELDQVYDRTVKPQI